MVRKTGERTIAINRGKLDKGVEHSLNRQSLELRINKNKIRQYLQSIGIVADSYQELEESVRRVLMSKKTLLKIKIDKDTTMFVSYDGYIVLEAFFVR